MTVTNIGNGVLVGLKTDTKPTTGYPVGTTFIETDRSRRWTWNGTIWVSNGYEFGNPSFGRWGRYVGAAEGVLNGLTTTTGFALSNVGATSTEPPAYGWSTGATGGTPCGVRSSGGTFVPTIRNPYIRFRFNIQQDATNSGFWAGLTNLGATWFPATGDPIANVSGIVFGFSQSATNFDVRQNNAGASSYSNLTSTPSFPTTAIATAVGAGNANMTTVELWTTDNGGHVQYSVNGSTPFTLSTTQLPGTSTSLGMQLSMTNVGSNTCTWRHSYWYHQEDPSSNDASVGLY